MKSERQRWVEHHGSWSGKRSRAKGGISFDARVCEEQPPTFACEEILQCPVEWQRAVR
jgi:hypothetical protein